MRNRFLIGSLLAAAALMAQASPVGAAEIREGESVVVGSTETIHDDLYAFGQNVTILGTVDGDVFAAGSSVAISGTVTGSVYAAGGTVTVSSDVQRSLRAAGGTVAVYGPVTQDALLAGGMVEIAAPARVGRDLLLAGSADVAAPVGRNVWAGSGELSLSAPIGGDVRADVGNLRLDSGASIAGDLFYTSDRQAQISPDVAVIGAIQHQPRPERTATPPAWTAGTTVVDWVRGLIGVLALALCLVLVFPRYTAGVTDTLTAQPWHSLGFGFGLVFGMPIVAAVVFAIGLLVGGWWLGLMLLMLYVICLVIGYALAAGAVGTRVVAMWGKSTWPPAVAVLIGLVLFGLIGLVPVVGGIVLTIALAAGLGAGGLVLMRAYRGPQAAVQGERAQAQPRAATAPSLA
jgi:cytoskeletal protein CcmA (bactofilin family)